MNFKKYRPILEVLVLSALIYQIHKLFFFWNLKNPKFQNFHFTIEVVDGFFFICSLVVIAILIKVKTKNIDNVGYTFILVTFIKMAISYTVLSPILESENLNIKEEKTNFFIIFAIFLAIETIVTIRMLSRKD